MKATALGAIESKKVGGDVKAASEFTTTPFFVGKVKSAKTTIGGVYYLAVSYKEGTVDKAASIALPMNTHTAALVKAIRSKTDENTVVGPLVTEVSTAAPGVVLVTLKDAPKTK